MGAKKAIAITITATFIVSGIFAATSVRAGSSDESRFVSLINGERRSRGIPTLVTRSDLVSVARRHSERMAAEETIYHSGRLANDIGGDWTALGENVGRGQSVESLHDAFMSSSSHRAIILDRDFNQIGVGVSIQEGRIYVTEIFAGRDWVIVRHRVPARPARASRPARPNLAPPGFRTIAILLTVLAMDAEHVDPWTGRASGV